MRGRTFISDKAISKTVMRTVEAIPGVISTRTGIAGLGSSYPRCDVAAERSRNLLRLDITIAVGWPSPVSAVAARVRDFAAQVARDATGMDVTNVNVTVAQAVAGEERVARSDLDSAEAPSFEVSEMPDPPAITAIRRVHGYRDLATDRQLSPALLPAESELQPVVVAPGHPASPAHADGDEYVR